MKRGQGTFEYVLLLGGVLLIVVLAIVVLQNTASSGFKGTGSKQCGARLLSEFACLNSDASWNQCGQIDNSSYVECGSASAPSGANCAPLAPGKKFCGLKPLG